MSKPDPRATAATRPITRRPAPARSMSGGVPKSIGRRASVSGLALTGNLNPVSGLPKAQRSSKTTQKLVVLPSEPQTKPLPPPEEEEDDLHGYETDRGVRDYKSAGERMTKAQREKAGFKRITAYCVADEFKMKLLASFLKREHNVQPRVFDEAMYVIYHLPLLPGYGRHSNIRSSAAPISSGSDDPSSWLSEAEEEGYQGTYFDSAPEADGVPSHHDGWMSSSPPVIGGSVVSPTSLLPPGEPPAETNPVPPRKQRRKRDNRNDDQAEHGMNDEDYAEVIFFAYGVVVFFGLSEQQERGILEDVEGAAIMRKKLVENDWEVEECHYAHDPNIAYPRIYNDFFTFKSHSHLLKLSVAHALAQSTLLAHYETHATRILSSPRTVSIPQQLASTGVLALPRKEALRLTGRLFTLRRDVNLVSNVLDVPELFWSEASLKALYDAVREYMEIDGRVKVLNEKLAVAEDLLGAIHDHLNNNAMERITWIIIWLIVVACLVESGEVIARLVVHATMGGAEATAASATCTNAVAALNTLSKEEALVILQRIANGGSM
ncbi:uncharacterized protein C8Q71DRAFT_708708 [Rhodofomes roseus]|uniref:DUF155 domain-containing protein n=1 Tax=Rhodofomes roseus TaxID=34475 RepID=A0ABQ8KGE0_9APHY|nr:uncharacterized protein C8Q71DRAFT_708708 [Rhodofomes roseus]KAH9836356.1 hypothetical protein C8Q71DRAFT_708708 [Rhodofomes roseus]